MDSKLMRTDSDSEESHQQQQEVANHLHQSYELEQEENQFKPQPPQDEDEEEEEEEEEEELMMNSNNTNNEMVCLDTANLALFDMERQRKPEYWQFIKLVAPQLDLPPGQKHWTTDDAKQSYCLKCKKIFPFIKGSSNNVKRHMNLHHSTELAQYLTVHSKRKVKLRYSATGEHKRFREEIKDEELRKNVEEFDLKHKKLKLQVQGIHEEVSVLRQQIQQDLYQLREQINLVTSTILSNNIMTNTTSLQQLGNHPTTPTSLSTNNATASSNGSAKSDGMTIV